MLSKRAVGSAKSNMMRRKVQAESQRLGLNVGYQWASLQDRKGSELIARRGPAAMAVELVRELGQAT